MAAARPPILPQNISQSLAERLVGAPGNPAGAPAPDPEGGARGGNEQQEPLQAQASSQQANRERFEENQRTIAAHMLGRAVPFVVCMSVFMLALAILGVALYFSGWMVFFKHGHGHQPLKWWLLAALTAPIVQCNGNCTQDRCLRKLNLLVLPTLIGVGTWLHYTCKTCEHENPPLYRFVGVYLVFQTVVWVSMVSAIFGLVTLVFWAARHGLLDGGPGPASAAKPGLVSELETVAFESGAFSQRLDDDKQPAECCICREEFSEERTIKRTPCGHFFHEDCLGEWLGNFARSCPLCRLDLQEALERGGGEEAAAEWPAAGPTGVSP